MFICGSIHSCAHCCVFIIGQPYCPMVGQRPQRAVSKLAYLVLSSARLCFFSICPGRLSTTWLVSHVCWCDLPAATRLFLSYYGLQVVTREIFEVVDMPCPEPFHFSHIVGYIYDFCPLPDPDVGLSIVVCDVEHTSFHFGLCCR